MIACQRRPVNPIINLMSRRVQFSLTWLFVAMPVVAAYFAGVTAERQRFSRARTKAAIAPPGALKEGQVP